MYICFSILRVCFKLQVRIIGLLELNANNNEEIKREAENIRKNYFLRALAAQYL